MAPTRYLLHVWRSQLGKQLWILNHFIKCFDGKNTVAGKFASLLKMCTRFIADLRLTHRAGDVLILDNP